MKPLIERIQEHVGSFRAPEVVTKFIQESRMPDIIRPEIRTLTADKVTRNYTYYPADSLRGKPSEGTGLISFIRPYPIPVIRDHRTGGWQESSEVYGRVRQLPKLITNGKATYVSTMPEITHPEAIENIMRGLWHTVSLGSMVESATCNICGVDRCRMWCDHARGEPYEVEKKKMVTCHHIIGPIRAIEESFVLVPSDDEAQVLDKGGETIDDEDESAKPVQVELTRFLVRCSADQMVDLVSRKKLTLQESALYLPAPPKVSFLFTGYNGRA